MSSLLIFFILNSILFVVKSNPVRITKNPEEGDFFEGDILGVVSTILKYTNNIRNRKKLEITASGINL